MPQKRFRSPAKKKAATKVLTESSLAYPACTVCAKAAIRGADGLKPYGWQDHCRNSDKHKKGFVLVLTCSDECRKVYYGGK